MYLKTWLGVISGGRDMGFPEEKRRIYKDIESLAKDFGTKNDEKYYQLTELDKSKLKPQVIETLNKEKERAKKKKVENIEEKIAELQKELNNLK